MSAVIAEGLVSVLAGTATVTPRLRQNTAFPVVRYQQIYSNRQKAVDGEKVGVTEIGIQLDCIAETYEAAKSLADAVRAVLDGYNGAWSTLTAHLVSHETENDAYEQDGDRVTHWVTQRYRIWTNID